MPNFTCRNENIKEEVVNSQICFWQGLLVDSVEIWISTVDEANPILLVGELYIHVQTVVKDLTRWHC